MNDWVQDQEGIWHYAGPVDVQEAWGPPTRARAFRPLNGRSVWGEVYRQRMFLWHHLVEAEYGAGFLLLPRVLDAIARAELWLEYRPSNQHNADIRRNLDEAWATIRLLCDGAEEADYAED